MIDEKKARRVIDFIPVSYTHLPQGKPTLVPASDKRPEMTNAKNDFANE